MLSDSNLPFLLASSVLIFTMWQTHCGGMFKVREEASFSNLGSSWLPSASTHQDKLSHQSPPPGSFPWPSQAINNFFPDFHHTIRYLDYSSYPVNFWTYICFLHSMGRLEGTLSHFLFESEKSERVSHSVVSDTLQPRGLQPTRLLCPWDSPGKNTGVGMLPFPSPGDLLNLGIKFRSPALQADSLPSEPQRKPAFSLPSAFWHFSYVYRISHCMIL